jgi:hypothetical protein
MAESSFKAMSRALDDYPDLSLWGFFIPNYRLPLSEGQREQFERDRARMFHNLEEFEAAQRWLRRWKVNPRWSSYGLKHKAEPEIGYCPNGVFIAAAAAIGLHVLRCDPRSPNATFALARETAGAP